ncbi:MAG: hypothetical protein CMC14_11435 [Flavobacteriaceae bacterium]|nr:hypothetical protein [Flavobacteriaceae bacterium]
MKGDREFNKFGENTHQQVIEMFEKDKAFQEEHKDYFSKNPNTLRIRFKQIEAGALGLRLEDDGTYTDFNTRTPATEKQLSTLKKQTDEAMLKQNPDMSEQGFEYKNGFIVPKSVKELQRKK